jgi:hypothetical protein
MRTATERRMMSRVFCSDCDSELNQLYAFERQDENWKARTHRLWYCPVCGAYLTINAPFTTRRGYLDSKSGEFRNNSPGRRPVNAHRRPFGG